MTNHFDAMTLEDLLEALRRDGWLVAVHNDYVIKGAPEIEIYDERATFWLFTHPCGIYVKGEAPTDKGAVLACAKAAHAVFSPSP